MYWKISLFNASSSKLLISPTNILTLSTDFDRQPFTFPTGVSAAVCERVFMGASTRTRLDL